MPQADAIATTLDPFALGGRAADPGLSIADQRLLRKMAASLWCAGQTDKWETFVVSMPLELAEEFYKFIERVSFADLDLPYPDDEQSEEEELNVLWQALRGRERTLGAVAALEREDNRRRKEAAAPKVYYPE